MIGVLGPDDLGQLTLVLSSLKHLNLSLSILFKVPIRVSYIYCYLVTMKDVYLVRTWTQSSGPFWLNQSSKPYVQFKKKKKKQYEMTTEEFAIIYHDL